MNRTPAAPPRGRRRAALGVAGVILVSAAAATWQGTRRTAPPAEPPPSVTAEPAPPVPPPAQAPAAPDPRPRFLAARAVFTCGAARGDAVFVGPERALASIPCREGQGQVRLSDGRDLLARVLTGAPAGTSVLELPGAAAPFVPPGSASGLAAGAPLLVGLEGAGPETIGEATARGLVAVDGLPLLSAEEAAGPLAGPVLDAEGSLVGLTPATPPDPTRPWLAVPVEAFAGLLGREVPAAWSAASEQAADEDRRAQGELWNRLYRSPVLLSATTGPNGLAMVVARAGAGRPPAETIRLEVYPTVPDCQPYGRIVDWRNGPRAFEGVPVPPAVRARLARIVPPPGGGSVWMGMGSLRLDCDASRVADRATLIIPGSDPLVPVPFPQGAVEERLPAAPAAPGPEEAQARAAAAEEEAAWEMGWRQAFREANQRIADAKRRIQDLQSQRDDARGNFQYALEQQLDTDIEIARLEEKRAEQALDELDRRASLAAVPRGWRRAE